MEHLMRKLLSSTLHLMAINDPASAASADLTWILVIFGIEEAVKEAQNGGTGVVIYFRKEGRALGEVTKVRTVFPLISQPLLTPV